MYNYCIELNSCARSPPEVKQKRGLNILNFPNKLPSSLLCSMTQSKENMLGGLTRPRDQNQVRDLCHCNAIFVHACCYDAAKSIRMTHWLSRSLMILPFIFFRFGLYQMRCVNDVLPKFRRLGINHNPPHRQHQTSPDQLP